jgi:bifunctional DNA-binding transcriptional regulator/antitoxin component of YhaV-PrlF toxin-antitoxin module
MKSWIITPEEDPETGDLIITFPPDALEAVGWQAGDVLTWTVKTNGSIILSKKDDND